MKPQYTYRVTSGMSAEDQPRLFLAYELFAPDGSLVCRGQFFGKEEELRQKLSKACRRLGGALTPLWSSGHGIDYAEKARKRGLRRSTK